MKYLQSALGIGPLFDTGETPSEEAKAELVQAARFLLDDPHFTLPDETTATPLELEDLQEALAVVLFKLCEHSIRLETQQKQLEVDALLPLTIAYRDYLLSQQTKAMLPRRDALGVLIDTILEKYPKAHWLDVLSKLESYVHQGVISSMVNG